MGARSATLQRSQTLVAVARPDQADHSARVQLLPPVIPDFEEALEVADATRHLLFPTSWSVKVGALFPCRLARLPNLRTDQQIKATAPLMLESHSRVTRVIRSKFSIFISGLTCRISGLRCTRSSNTVLSNTCTVCISETVA
jgi:hypothetical protein